MMGWDKQNIGRRGEILIKDVYRCSFCGGTGLLFSKKGIKCPVCLGDGKVNISTPAVVCVYCNGTGRRYLRTTLTCAVCRGKGVVSIGVSQIQTCTICKGAGRESGKTLPCLTCKGKGVIAKPSQKSIVGSRK